MFAIILLALAQLGDAHTSYGPFIINDQPSRQQVRSNVEYVDRNEMALSYFSQCSGVSIDSSSCIENKFFNLFNVDKIIHQMHETFDCTPPSFIEPTYINNLISSAIETCEDEGVSLSSIEIEKSFERLNALVGSVSCWKSLCYDDSFITITSSWLETCANIEFPTVTVDDMLLDKNDFMCMIDSTLHQLQNEAELDYHDNCGQLLSTKNLYDKCQNVIGPNALMACSSQTYMQTQPMRNLYETSFRSHSYLYSYEYSGNSYSGSYQYSYEYSNSMSYSYPMSYSYVTDDDVEKKDVLDEFCLILDQLSSNEGQECLSAVCDVMGRTENSQPPSSVPTLLTSMMPSYEPSDQPTNPPSHLPTNTPSYLPTDSPSYLPSYTLSYLQSYTLSYLPSNTPSSLPTDSPSSLPSNTPSYLPTNPPSHLPSAQPSSKPTIIIDEEKSTVAIKFEAGIVLNNIDDSDIPPPGPDLDNMVKVLTDVINKMLPSGAKARILKIGSVSLNRRILRFLQQGTNIEFEVIMKKICASEDCSDATSLADTMYQSVTEEIKVSVSNGSFSSSIQQEAASKGVTVLASVTVDKESFKATERTVELDIIELEDDDTDDNSSVSIGTKARSCQHTLIIVLSAYFAANIILRM